MSKKSRRELPAALSLCTHSATVALVAVLILVLVLVLVLVAVLVLIGILVLVLVAVLVIVHEDTSFCTGGTAIVLPVFGGIYRKNHRKKGEKAVDKEGRKWYNTPENKEGRCIRPHLQQRRRGQQRELQEP